MTTAEPPTAERAEFWARTRRGWDLAFYGMVLVAGVGVGLGSRPPWQGVGLAGIAALVLAYLLLGRRAARDGDARLAVVYLLVMIALVAGVVAVTPVGTVLLFIGFSQIWYLSSSRRAGVALCVVLTAAVVVAGAFGWRPASLVDFATNMSLALVFAILLGLWITHIAERGEERAWLLERLHAAQDELARAHRAEGVVAERERLAREIHDTLAQGFTSVVALAQAARADLRRDDVGAAANRLDVVEQTARENLAEARALVAAFSPVGLDGSTLDGALRRLADRFAAETAITVDLDAPSLPLRREQEVVLLRATQEALANVRRHSGAHHVRVVLRQEDDDVVLEVVDDGRGPDAATTEGFGLSGMRDRVNAHGGDVRLTADGGARLVVRLPRQEDR